VLPLLLHYFCCLQQPRPMRIPPRIPSRRRCIARRLIYIYIYIYIPLSVSLSLSVFLSLSRYTCMLKHASPLLTQPSIYTNKKLHTPLDAHTPHGAEDIVTHLATHAPQACLAVAYANVIYLHTPLTRTFARRQECQQR